MSSKEFMNNSNSIIVISIPKNYFPRPVLVEYTRFVGRYVIGRRKRFRSHIYIFLMRITSRVDLVMSVCPSVCPSV